MPEKRKTSLLHFVSFKISERVYALSLENVESVHRMVALTLLPEAPSWVAEVINFHGQRLVFEL